MTRREFGHVLLGGCLSALALPSSAVANTSSMKKPNVLLVLTDDQGFGDVRSHGNDKIDTPTMDGFAREGARFDRFFVSPVCAPTRASILTGRYHLRTGASGVTRGRENMRSEELTLAEILNENGYATGCFGKWHNGAHYPEHPNGQGFDEFFGFCGGVWNNYFDAELEHNGEVVKTDGYITDVLTDKAMEFIRKNRESPFFCYVPYNAPHTPCLVPDRYFDKYSERGFDARTSAIYGMIENIDDNFRRILDILKNLGLEDDTVVIFMTDNGPNGKRYNAGMRGSKSSFHEGGVRVPMFIRWPGHIKAGTVIKENASHIDLLPTIADLCEVTLEETLPLDGINIAPLLMGRAESWPDRMIFTFPTPRELTPAIPGAVRTQRWRAVKRKGNWELHDMTIDPEQKKDVAKGHPIVVTKLSTAYEELMQEMTRNGLEILPIQIGHPGWPVVTLPGHEAHLKSSNGKGIGYNYGPGYTNHWITNWTETASYPLWDIQVVRSGLYEVTLMYTCKQEDTGVKLRVEIGDAHLDGHIQEPYDPDPIPVPFRLKDEATKYMSKVWKAHRLGQVSLGKGRTQLIVRATHIPGTQAIDLKAVQLRRIHE